MKIKGTFSDFKIIKTRGACQFIIEIDESQANEALQALGGLPMSGSPKWVEIALFDSQSSIDIYPSVWRPALGGKVEQEIGPDVPGAWENKSDQ